MADPVALRVAEWQRKYADPLTAQAESMDLTGMGPTPVQAWTPTPVPDRLEKDRTADYAAMMEAMSLHLRGDAGWSPSMAAIKPLARMTVDRFYEEEPAALRMIQEDLRWVKGLTDDEIGAALTAGTKLFPNSGDLMDIVAEVAFESGARELYEELLGAKQARARDGYERIIGPNMEELTRRVVSKANQLAATSDDPNARTFASQIEGVVRAGVVEMLDFPTVWQWDGDQGLVFQVQATTDSVKSVGLRLDPGTQINDTMDALEALMLAKGGLAHELSSDAEIPRDSMLTDALQAVSEFAETNPAMGYVFDAAINTYRTQTGRFRETLGDPNPFTSRSLTNLEVKEERRLQLEEMYTGSATVAEMTDLAMRQTVADLADTILNRPNELLPDLEEPVILAAGPFDALALARDIVGENPEIRDMLEAGSIDAVVEESLTVLEEETVLGEKIRENTDRFFTALQKWDDIAQNIGLNFFDFVADTVGMVLPDEVQAAFIGEADPQEGFNAWQTALRNMWEEEKIWERTSHANVADYFGLEDGWADFALLSTSIVFDPINYVFAGPKFASKLGVKILANPRYAPLAVKMPAGRRLVTDLLNAEGAKGLRLVAGMGGLTEDTFTALARVAMKPKAQLTRREVEEALLKAMPSTDGAGFFLIGPADRMRTRGFAEWVAGMMDQVALFPADQQERVFQSLAKLSRTRSVSLSDSQFIDEFLDLVVIVGYDDVNLLDTWSKRLFEDVSKGTVKRDEWYSAALLRAQQTQDHVTTLGKEYDLIEERIVTLGEEIDRLKSQIANVKAQPGFATKTKSQQGAALYPFETQRRKLGKLRQQEIGAKRQRRGPLKAARKSLTAAQKDLKAAARSNNRILNQRLLLEFYDDLAKRLKLEPLRDARGGTQAVHKAHPDLIMYDWSPVTGPVSAKRITQAAEQKIEATAGLVGQSSLVDNLNAVGVFDRLSTQVVPASPYEIITYMKWMDRPDLLRKLHASQVRQGVTNLYMGYRKLFAANLLINAFTPIVTNLDEVMRFYARTGNVGKTIRASLAPVPGVGARATTGVGKSRLVPEALVYQRDMLGELGGNTRSWQWVENPGRPRRGPTTPMTQAQYRDTVVRFINGQLLNDDIFRMWAQNRRNPGLFRKWWEEGIDGGPPGAANARRAKVNLVDPTQGTPFSAMGADEVEKVIEKSLESWLSNFVDPALRNKMRTRIIDAAATGNIFDRVGDARLLGAVKKVPGIPAISSTPKPGNLTSMNWWFEMLYGTPGQRRGAVFFDHYFEEAYSIYRSAYEAKGTLLTPERLVEVMTANGAPIGRDEAVEMLARVFDDPRLNGLLRGGYVTDAAIRAQAARYAARRSDELMYSLASTSLWGQTVESAMPFARAQTDFLGWWWKHLTTPSLFRMGPEVRSFLTKSGLGRSVLALERLPINYRAWAKYAHLAATFNNDYDSSHPGGIDWAMDKFTFFPLQNSGDIMMDVLPSPLFGRAIRDVVPWVASAVMEDFLYEMSDEEVERIGTMMEEIWPAMGFSDGGFWSMEWLGAASERSLRNVMGQLLTVVNAMTVEGQNVNATNVAKLGSWLSVVDRPLGTSDRIAAGAIELLRSGELDSISPWERDTRWRELVVPVIYQGSRDAALNAGKRTLAGQVKASVFDPDNAALIGYEEIIRQFNWLASIPGLLPASVTLDVNGTPRLLRVWEKWKAGESSVDEDRWLADELAGLNAIALKDTEFPGVPGLSIRDYLMARDPGLAVNSISKIQVNPDLKEMGGDAGEFYQKHAGPNERLVDMPPGEDGRKLRREALSKGWLIARPEEDWIADAHGFSESSKRRVIRQVWEAIQLRSGVEVRGWGDEITWRSDPDTFGFTSEIGMSQERQRQVVSVSEAQQHLLEIAGVEVEAGSYSLLTLRLMLDGRYRSLASGPSEISHWLNNSRVSQQLNDSAEGRAVLQSLQGTFRGFSNIWDDIDDFPEELKDSLRDEFVRLVDVGLIDEAAYRQDVRPILGGKDWEPPTPPNVSDLEKGWRVTGQDVRSGLVEAIDGDTITVEIDGQELRVRLIGINAPEAGTGDEAVAATQSLQSALMRADEIVFGFYQPRTFGTVQLTAPGQFRLLAWLYINGTPVYNENVFSARNVTGAQLGGDYVDIWELYERRAPAPAGRVD